MSTQQEPQDTAPLPLVIAMRLHFSGHADRVDTEIYCVNETDRIYRICSSSSSFTTIDENSGMVAEHSPPPVETTLAPGQMLQIGYVCGWEWDGAVGMDLKFAEPGQSQDESVAYSLRDSPVASHRIAILDREGNIRPRNLPPYSRDARRGHSG